MSSITLDGTHARHVDDGSMSRKYLLLPGVRSDDIYVVDTATDPKTPSLFKTIDGDEIKEKANLSGPHTVHCLGSEIIISFLGTPRVKRQVVTCTSAKNLRSRPLGEFDG